MFSTLFAREFLCGLSTSLTLPSLEAYGRGRTEAGFSTRSQRFAGILGELREAGLRRGSTASMTHPRTPIEQSIRKGGQTSFKSLN